MSSVFSRGNPDLARCFGIFASFQEQTSFLTPPLWEEQKLVGNTLCQGSERRRPTTPRRPLCEEERMARKGVGEGGRKRKRLALRVGGGRGREGREGEAASDDCHAASECQRRSHPESWQSRRADEQTGDTKQTAALTSSERRRRQRR